MTTRNKPHRNTIEEDFRVFHDANPEVYTILRRLALNLKQAEGAEYLSIKMLFEVVRYEQILAGVKDEQGFNLNNSYTSYYARLLMEYEPQLSGMFKLRGLTIPFDPSTVKVA